MADITVTAASVMATSTTTTAQGTAGATITAGQPLYQDSTASFTLKPAQATSQAAAAMVGIALNNASSGQPVTYAIAGDVTYNAALTKGSAYVVSAAAAGGVAPIADLIAGNFTSLIGVATSTTNLKLAPCVTGVAK